MTALLQSPELASATVQIDFEKSMPNPLGIDKQSWSELPVEHRWRVQCAVFAANVIVDAEYPGNPPLRFVRHPETAELVPYGDERFNAVVCAVATTCLSSLT